MKLDHYLGLVTSEHSDKPRFVEMITTSAKGFVSDQEVSSRTSTLYDLDSAIGRQLDVVGEWVGRSRDLKIPLQGVYFSLDTEGVGFDEGTWKGRFDPDSGLVSLPDDSYRTLLKATIAANYWNGTIPQAYEIWEVLFEEDGYEILIQDYGDMTMLIALVGPTPDAVTLALFKGGYLSLNPAGVQIIYYVVPSVPDTPIFGFDADGEYVKGFDQGCWAQPI